MIHLLLFALLGTAISAVASLVPALHIYNVAGVVLLFDQALLSVLTPEELAFVFLGMVTGYAILNTVPGVLLSVPDESTLFLMLPVQRYLHQGRGYEGWRLLQRSSSPRSEPHCSRISPGCSGRSSLICCFRSGPKARGVHLQAGGGGGRGGNPFSQEWPPSRSPDCSGFYWWFVPW